MIKHLAIATLALCSAFGALAQSTQSSPPAHGAADPVRFAEHKKLLLETRAKGTACIIAANDRPALVECLKAEHEAMRAAHGSHEGPAHEAGPARAPAAPAAPAAR